MQSEGKTLSQNQGIIMLHAGFAKIDITPALGCGMQGYFKDRFAESVHDPLYAHALVIDDKKTSAGIVSCDLIGLEYDTVQEARRIIEQETGIPDGHMIICGTHVHTGPITICHRRDADVAIDKEWRALLPRKIASAAIQAFRQRRPTGMACECGEENRVSFHRRFVMKNGRVQTNPGRQNPDIVKPAGPIDPEMGVLAFGSGRNAIMGTLVNFTLHLDTIAGNNISADFPGVIERVLNGFAPGIGFVYTSGAMGNINHCDVTNPVGRKYEYFEHAARIGGMLGGEVIKTMARMRTFRTDVAVGARRAPVTLPLKECGADELAKARRMVEKGAPAATLSSEKWLHNRALIIAAKVGRGEITTEITAIRVGDVAFVGIPGEYFVEFGLEIKRRSPFGKTFVVELTGDYLGYISTKEGIASGGYESSGTIFKPGAGEILRDAALDLLKKLRGTSKA